MLALGAAAFAEAAEVAPARWYKGMIHAHTCWSDGRALPEQAAAAYENGGYDFFSIADHNRFPTETNNWMEVAPLKPSWPPSSIEPSVFAAYTNAFPESPWRMRDGKIEVRVTPIDELIERFNKPGKFLMIPGCEVTLKVLNHEGSRHLHMNYLGIGELLPSLVNGPLSKKVKAKSAADVLRAIKSEFDALVASRTNAPHLFFLNHPHWQFNDVLPETLAANPSVRFFEVCNNYSEWPVVPPLPDDGFDTDRFWDVVNAIRCTRGEPLLYGIGTEDSHWYPDSGSSHTPIVFGDSWISVRAGELTSAALFAAMDKGDFYASCGVDLEDVNFDAATGTLSVSVPAKPGVSYTVKFITTKRGVSLYPVKTVDLPAEKGGRPARSIPIYSDRIGAVAKQVSFGKGEPVRASYTLAPGDLYVRARIESSEPTSHPQAKGRMHPPMKVAWTQPYRIKTEPVMTWGAREERPAVVNSVVRADPENVISLRGEWEFSATTMSCPWRNGIWKHFYRQEKWPNARKINVPGCWEAQGVGRPGPSECWDAVWDNSAKPIRHKYMGEAWYRRSVDIPAGWAGKRIWLKVGGVKSCGWFWVNGRQVALVDNYCGTYKYEITDLVKPGETATVVAHVSNTRPSRKGLMSNIHRWGGIYRDVEIEATPHTFIDDAYVRGDFDSETAEAHVAVAGGGKCEVRFTVDGVSTVSRASDGGGETVLRLRLPAFRAWSPERPNLYTGVVELVENGVIVQRRFERFGIRKFEVRGKEFYLNNKLFFVRGFGDDSVYPLTGLSPADRDIHRSNLAKARAAGFNFVRLHTHCELPEYFEAADELGIMIQPELPYYSDAPTEGFAFDPHRDVTELYRHYRRHPSFAVYSMGNEGSFGPELDRRLHAYVKAIDLDRLKINQDCHVPAINPPESSDYAGGPIDVWRRGGFNPDRPFVTHEYLNLCVKTDSRDEGLYTGAWLPPVTRASREKWLGQFGLSHAWGDRLQDAQHALQRHYQKRGIEAARLDPYCDGYCFWTLVDVVVAQGASYSAQGLFNPFWQTKRGGFTAEEFSLFNRGDCLLANVPKGNRVLVSGDMLPIDFLFSNYGEDEIKRATLEWRMDGAGRNFVVRSIDAGDIPLGPVRKIATDKIEVPSVEKPVKVKLSARVGKVANEWDFWVFPRRAMKEGGDIAVAPALKNAFSRLYRNFSVIGEPAAEKAAVHVVVPGTPEEAAALAAGRRTVSIGKATGVPNVKLGWWWMGSQVGTALLAHPVFGDLPHEGVLSPLLFRIIGKGKPLARSGIAESDLFMVGEGGSECSAYLFRRKVGQGKAIESCGLDLLSGNPEGSAILDGMINFARNGL